ncbi:MAG: hypothetical protein ABL899_02730 [Nitrospira sp.]
MAKKTTSRRGVSSYLFSDESIRVSESPTGEVVVEDTASGAKIKICATPGGLAFTALDHCVEPRKVTNGIGYLVTPK